MSWNSYGWQPYVPVAQRRAKAARELAKQCGLSFHHRLSFLISKVSILILTNLLSVTRKTVSHLLHLHLRLLPTHS